MWHTFCIYSLDANTRVDESLQLCGAILLRDFVYGEAIQGTALWWVLNGPILCRRQLVLNITITF